MTASRRASDMKAARVIRKSEARRLSFEQHEADARAAWGDVTPDPADRRARTHLTVIAGGLPVDAPADAVKHRQRFDAVVGLYECGYGASPERETMPL